MDRKSVNRVDLMRGDNVPACIDLLVLKGNLYGLFMARFF